MMQKIYPYLWFDKNLKEIIEYYQSVFPDMEVTMNEILSGSPSGDIESAILNIKGQKFGVMAAGPMFKFTEAISFVINCDTQEEIDYYWGKLSSVPEAEQCGWCKDKYGLSWQVCPAEMEEQMIKGSKEQVARVMEAFMPMKKLDAQKLRDAFEGKS
jgi:predicted 3-demethylubiquinone-9 3-methyltransferase (glyoxalase superfamily)